MKGFARCALVIVALVAALHAQALPQGTPDAAGLSRERLDRATAAMRKEAASGQMAGGVGLIARRGTVGYFESYGLADREAGRPMQKDTIFRIFSMTKPVTGVAIMMLHEQGRLGLTDPVSQYLPEFTAMKVAVHRTDASGRQVLSHTVDAEQSITILDLLRHTSGFNYEGPYDEKGNLAYQALGLNPAGGLDVPLAEFVKRLASVPLVHQPGTILDYSFSMDVLGRVVEVVSGQPLDRFFADRIFTPLRMVDTGFYVPKDKWDRLATLYIPTPNGVVRADETMQAAARSNPVLLMGGAGLHSTALDYARFAQMLLDGGQLDGVRVLGEKSVAAMATDVLGDLPGVPLRLALGPGLPATTSPMPPPGYGFGLTVAVNRGAAGSGAPGSKGEYTWSGAAGTTFWVDPGNQMVGVFMVQSMLDLSKGMQFKQLAYDAIAGR